MDLLPGQDLQETTGARTQMYCILTSVIILLSTFFLLQYLFYLPKCVLASIICMVIYTILAEAPHDLKFFWKMRAWNDLGLLLLTLFLTVFWNVQVGIMVSAALSLVLVIRSSAGMRVKILGRVPGTDVWEPVDDTETPQIEDEIPGVLIVRIRETLTFANAGALKERLRRLELYGASKHHPSDHPTRTEAQVLIFHLADVEHIDASALQIVSEVVEGYVRRRVQVFFTHVHYEQRIVFAKSGLLELIGRDHLQPSVKAALEYLEESKITVGTVED